MSISLHPEFGVNPSLGTCFWCGGDTGEVLLLGYNKGKEATRKSVASYEPCGKCKAEWAQGIVLIEVVPRLGETRPEIVPGGIPTGRLLVIKEEALPRFIRSESLVASVLKARKAVIERAVFEELLDASKRANQPDKSDGEKLH